MRWCCIQDLTVRHSKDLDLTEGQFLTLIWLTPVLAHNTFRPSTYQADFTRFKEDLASVFKSKLEIDMGGSRLYQKPYPPEFDFVSYPAGWHVPEFVKFNGDDSHTTWEHVS